MARALIVGCGCRGRELGAALAQDGWVVRGTSRTDEGAEMIESAGIDAAVADPERPGTILDLVEDVAVVFWLLGSATGGEEVAAVHGPRLEALLERLVDTPVRGFVYEARGTVDAGLLDAGAAAVRMAGATWRIPVAVVDEEPIGPAWVEAMRSAAKELLG